MRIVILTAPIGGGHTSAATSLAAQLAEEDTEIVISAHATAGALRMLPRTYSYFVTRLPAIWALYYYSRKLRLFKAFNRTVVRRASPSLSLLAADGTGADLAIITQSMYCNLIADLKKVASRVIIMPTDLFGGPNEWFLPDANLYVVASQQMRIRGIAAGIPGSRIIVRRLPTGVPIADVTAKLPGFRAPRILVVGGAEGAGPILRVTSGLSRARCSPDLTVVCGHNKKLASLVRRNFPEVRALPFVPDLARTFSEYDLIVTKPGSLTLQEAADAGTPFLLMTGIPGIEAPNSHTGQRCGIPLVRDARSARAALDKLIDQTGCPLPEWRDLINANTAFRNALPGNRFSLDDIKENVERDRTF